MVVFQAAEQPPQRALASSDGGGSSTPHEAQVSGGQAPGREGEKGEETRGQGRWRFLSGAGGGGEQGGSETATADKLPPLLPEGDGWTIGFAAGDKSAFANGVSACLPLGRGRDGCVCGFGIFPSLWSLHGGYATSGMSYRRT